MRIKLVVLLIFICAGVVNAQEDKCSLKLSELPAAPELFGFQMGMSPAQLKQRVPQVAFGRADDFGVSKTSISPDFDPQIDRASFAGIRTVSFDFLDGRLTSLWFGYDGSFKWKTVPEFVKGISRSLRLPDAWTTWKVRGQQLNCADFQLTLSIVAEGPSFRLIDKTAEETVAARRDAKAEQEAALEEGEAGEVIADSRALVYYADGCTPSQEIERKDRVVFRTKEEAEKAGYKPSKNCQ